MILWFLVTPGVVGLLLLLALEVGLGVVAPFASLAVVGSREGLLGLWMFSKVKTRTSASFSDDSEEDRDGGAELLVDELNSE